MAKRKRTDEKSTELTLIQHDPYLKPFESVIRRRLSHIQGTEQRLTQGKMSLPDFASGHDTSGSTGNPTVSGF